MIVIDDFPEVANVYDGTHEAGVYRQKGDIVFVYVIDSNKGVYMFTLEQINLIVDALNIKPKKEQELGSVSEDFALRLVAVSSGFTEYKEI